MSKIVYLVARNGETQGNLCLYNGDVLLFLPNYTQIEIEKPVTVDRDQFIYSLEVADDSVHQAPGEPWRLWAGPKGCWNHGGDTIRCAIRTTPPANPSQAPEPVQSLDDVTPPPPGLTSDGE